MDHQRIHSSYDNTLIANNIALRSESLAERLLHPYDFKNISDGCEIAILRANKLQRLLGSESDTLRKYLLWSRFQCLEKLPIGEPKSTALFIGSEEWVKTLSTLFDYLDNAKSEYLPNISGDFGLNDFSCKILASIYNKIYPEDLRDGVGVHIYACSIAIEKLKNVCTPEELELLSDDALKDMLKHLWAMQHQACISIFDRSRNLHERLFSGREEERLRFHNWLIYNAGYKDLLKEHSALARIIANGVDLWVNDTSQLLKRLKKDQHEIVETIDIGVKPFIIKVDDGLSDPHDGKQFVKRLWFKNGSGLIYKPRDISLLESLGNAIQIIKENAGNIDLRVPRCISKENYGWAELINQEECLSEKEVETYFNRCGQLVAVLYLTRTNDIHHENLIASGDQPVLIDTDTLFYPGFFDLSEPHYPTDLSSNTELAVEESILSSGVLPFWDNINGELKDLSGISSLNEAGKNIVRFQGKVQRSYQFKDKIIDGFRSVATGVLQQKGFFSNLLESFRGSTTRAIYRPTRVYERIRQNLLLPKNLTDGITRSVALEYLKLSLLHEKQKPQGWVLVDEEIKMLFNDDIPTFSIACGDNEIILFTGEHVKLRCGIEIAQSRLRRLSQSFIEYQVELINASCHFEEGEKGKPIEQNTNADPIPTFPEDAVDYSLSRQNQFIVFERTAWMLIERLVSRSHISQRYGRSWIETNLIEPHEKFQLVHAGIDLYKGNSGIALALAAQSRYLHKVANNNTDCLNQIMHDAFRPINDLSQDPKHINDFVKTFGVGVMTGLGSLIFSCTACARLQECDSYLEIAELLAKAVTTKLLLTQSSADLMNGLAGLLISIIELNKLSQQRVYSDISILIGERICSLQKSNESKYLAWPNEDGVSLLGLSHGAAGVALALFRLYEQSGCQKFKEAALQGVHYENSKCDIVTNNWPDLRRKRAAIMNSWCNGAPGIGLSRLEMYKIEPNPLFLEDINKAVHLSVNNLPSELDQLCCGALGISEFLFSAGMYLDRRYLVSLSIQIANSCIQKSLHENKFRLLNSLPPGFSSPGFMQGEAGIAYHLLRLNQPAQIPSILALRTD